MAYIKVGHMYWIINKNHEIKKKLKKITIKNRINIYLKFKEKKTKLNIHKICFGLNAVYMQGIWSEVNAAFLSVSSYQNESKRKMGVWQGFQ